MECNKDEAFRAKEIAERKVKEKDYAGAKKFALKAQNLYPGLDGIGQMLITLDVYISAENQVSGEADWYGVLGVNPSDDDEVVRKQYRKLALMLHPDKNKSVGADGAFKVVSEAWSLLSDKNKRLEYNKKINFRGTQQKYPTQSGVSSMPPRANSSHSSSSSLTSNARTQNSNSRVGQTSFTSPNKKPATFWTVCNRCKTQYEYLRIYLNHTLLCPNCHEAFLALEKAPPPNVYRSSNWSGQQQASGHHAANNNPFNYGTNSSSSQNSEHEQLAGHGSSNNTSFQWGSFSKAAGVSSTVPPPCTSAEAASVVRRAQERVKREREEALKAERLLKKRKDDIRVNGFVGNMATQTTMGNGPGLGNTFEARGVYEIGSISGNHNKPISERELSLIEIRNMLMHKALSVICKKLKEWSSVTEKKNADKVKEKVREKENRKQRSMANGDGRDANKEFQSKLSLPAFSDDLDTGIAPITINVPDPDFHNFDLNRSESSFEDDQVWAAYDDDDGMPRFYARIHKVISLKPFKMKISWLNSRSNSEFGLLDWIGSGFSKTCGEFRSGRHEISETLNSFSHKVQWTKGTRGVIRIFPRKGDVWALYRNWSPDWNEHTPDEVIHKYDMVEVLDDYNEEQGVSVVPLIKVNGFRTVFRKHVDPKEVRKILKEEMFRFSHQVPNYLLTGHEAPNAPMGCRELDPAATPLELLQVINEASEAPVEDDSWKTDKETLKSAREGEADGREERIDQKPRKDSL
ncbi:uncharacterized protein LOC111290702 [Durio zibethinus]|uniref:Uncharacterized protein LOC111290702 n=1 Tax=Durio zibethinus TaxID=66656 RepID=A0A6P5YBL0_DURZI|nr:uncharacterized protein LOC111290702 [Durio zibethinus]XP_022737859.1 uncharacterized protein LOC111290702 [Durio zibethinus]XP_022737860.1 uncharacterized protein LOC111290702 [Durio zibethinus]XP_022737862.1 uncharacterized protein LOC111290702 [Durio zibethinus]XP_022737863.1 uncharacterized protein LOC111290702 [Durio zibethinus]